MAPAFVNIIYAITIASDTIRKRKTHYNTPIVFPTIQLRPSEAQRGRATNLFAFFPTTSKGGRKKLQVVLCFFFIIIFLFIFN